MIKIEHVSKDYPGGSIGLKNLSLEIQGGDFVSIVGRSGSGKSTLVRLLIAEEQPTAGDIWIDDWHINRLKPFQVPYYRRQIGVVFQDFKLLARKTVWENVAFALEVSGESDARIKQRVPEVLELVGLADKHDRFPEQLSGGEQQRVAIARALAHEPRLLIADEPTGNLDHMNSWEIMELLLKINERGTTVIMVSHNREIIDKIRRSVVVLDHGELVMKKKVGKYEL